MKYNTGKKRNQSIINGGVVPAHAHDDSSFHPSENASQSMAKNGLEINTYTMLDLPTEKVHSVNVDLPTDR